MRSISEDIALTRTTEKANAQPMNIDTDPVKILIVDDQPANLLSLEMQLESPDLTIIKASSGNEALTQTLKHEFALVLMDVQMPEMDGFETAELMRSNPKTRNIPIIFVTAISKEQKHVFKGYESGAVDYLFKPLDVDVLKSKVNVFLELRRQQIQLQAAHDLLEAKVQERTADLNKAKVAAESANSAKSEFLTNMSHELRTPLHGILSFADLGMKRYDSLPGEKVRHYFSRVHESGVRLLELLNDLLDLANLESTEADYLMQKQNLMQIANTAIYDLARLTVEKNLSLEIVEAKATETIFCDASKIGQLFRCLLSNAIKFTPEGKKITISFRTTELLINNERVEAVQTTVSDQGIGVPEDELELIFKNFTQSSRTRDGAGGRGLGLAICRQIADHHNGKIWAENLLEGTAFHFVIPCSEVRR